MNVQVKWTGPDAIKVPEDFAERAHWSNRQLKAHYNVGDKTLARWRREANLPSHAGRSASDAARARWGKPLIKNLPPPNDFADLAKRHVNKALSARFNVSENTITRWRKETGTTSSIVGYRTAPLPKAGVPPIAAGEASEACQFLRKDFRPVYHRGVVEGKQFKGQYVVGRNVFNEQELIDFARARGFRTGAEELAAFDKYD